MTAAQSSVERLYSSSLIRVATTSSARSPRRGKPLQILIGDEWKTIEPTPQIKVDSTRHFFTKELVFFPIVDYGQELPIAFYPTPQGRPSQAHHPEARQAQRCKGVLHTRYPG